MQAMRLMYGSFGRIACAILLLIACLAAACLQTQAKDAKSEHPLAIYDPQLLSFGPWVHTDSDDPTFASPDFDVSDWKAVTPGMPRHPLGTGVRWYRAKFTIGWQYRTRNLGVALGKVGQAHQVFINGHLVGAEGGFDRGFVDAGRKSSVFPIGINKLWFSFLNLTRSNVIAVRVDAINAPLSLDVAAVQIDDLYKLRLASTTSDTYVKFTEGGALSFLILIAVFCGFLFVSGIRGRSNALFGLLVLLASISILTDSLLLYDGGWKNAFTQRTTWLMQVAATAVYVRMVHVELGSEPRLWGRLIEYGIIGIAFLVVAVPAILATPLATPLIVGMPILLLVPALWCCVHAMRRSVPNSVIVMLTTLVLLATAVGAPFLFFANLPLYPLHLGLLSCGVILLLPIARQFHEMMRREIALSRRLVNVRDLERTRLARDMHDGVGQSLAAVGLHLRLMTRDTSDPHTRNLASAVDHLTEELREVIGNLRPSNLQEYPLGRAIELHFNRTLSGSGVGFTIGRIDEPPLPIETKEHLFRIYQEALHNALRHSHCSNMSFNQKLVGRYLRLSIGDDGCGFKTSAERNRGLGLSTMRERALLMNASLAIVSNPGEGTVVSIEVPVHD